MDKVPTDSATIGLVDAGRHIQLDLLSIDDAPPGLAITHIDVGCGGVSLATNRQQRHWDEAGGGKLTPKWLLALPPMVPPWRSAQREKQRPWHLH